MELWIQFLSSIVLRDAIIPEILTPSYEKKFTMKLLIVCFAFFFVNICSSASLAGDLQSIKKSPVEISEIDCSWFPMVKTTIYFENGFTDNDELNLFENNKEIQAFKRIFSDSDKQKLIVKWLCRSSTEGEQNFEVTLNGFKTNRSFSSFKNRRFGEKIQQTVKIYTLGPGKKHFPCRIVALHENGAIFEDISTKGGLGKLGSGFAIPSGNMMVELRLLSPDVGIDHFKVYAKPFQLTSIKRVFGYFKLPFSKLTKIEQLKIHIEIEGKNSRYPFIHSNLFSLYSKLAPVFPEGVIPLPAGKYVVYLLPAASDSKQARERYDLQIVEGTTARIN